MLKLSGDGLIELTRPGWNPGKPPYGYLAAKVPHPVLTRHAEGRTSTACSPPRPTHLPSLESSSAWHRRAGLRRHRREPRPPARLYPPPLPTRAHVGLGRRSGSTVREILYSPEYAGYQVCSRRATKKGGRHNDSKDWVRHPCLLTSRSSPGSCSTRSALCPRSGRARALHFHTVIPLDGPYGPEIAPPTRATPISRPTPPAGSRPSPVPARSAAMSSARAPALRHADRRAAHHRV